MTRNTGLVETDCPIRRRIPGKTGDLNRASAIFPMLDRAYLLPTLPGYFDLITKAGARIRYNALVAYINDDAEARDAAKTALLAVMKWPSWVPPWFPANGQPTYYPAGEFTAQIAFAYDLLYDPVLAAGTRDDSRRACSERHWPAYREYVVDDRILSNTSNWISHSVAGSLLAAAAIAGEVKIPISISIPTVCCPSWKDISPAVISLMAATVKASVITSSIWRRLLPRWLP